MHKSADTVAHEVATRAKSVDAFLNRIERLRGQGYLSNKDAERSYTGAFLEFHAFVEQSIERLFVGLLRERLKCKSRSVRPLIAVNSDVVALRIVRGDRRYIDWLPYNQYTMKRASAFFSRGDPFSRLDGSDIAVFEEASWIRNALAHQSRSALTVFKDRLVKGKSLPPDQQRPAGYLRGIHTAGQTRMGNILARAVIVMTKLSA